MTHTNDANTLLFERYIRALRVTLRVTLLVTRSVVAEQSRAEQMIGVKRPAFKLGNPKLPKSAKKKKALKETMPIPDPDDATVIANPYAEYMVQKPSELMQEIEVPPHQSIVDNPHAHDPSEQASCSIEPGMYKEEVLEEGEIPKAEEMVKNLNYVKGNILEFPPKLPHMMGFRYKLLLEKANPKELVPGQPPSLTWLEEQYGHLNEKEFWYDRTVQLAFTYLEICEGDVFDKTLNELEKAVGHLVPYTEKEKEKEYLRLMQNYQKSPVQIDGIPTLEFLRTHHSKPPTAKDRARILKVEQIPPSPVDQQEGEGLTRYVPITSCPIHEDANMKCLNADDLCGALLFKCTKPGCSVFYTSDTSEDVRHQLCQAIHPSVHQGLFDGTLKCHCEYTPRMKLSQSQKNPARVFLSCFKKTDPCCYFQWVHWKVRPLQGPMDAFVQKQPRATPFAEKPGRLYYTRPNRSCPPEIQQMLREQASQQLVCTGLDRFKKDNVQMFPPSPWKRKPETAESAWGSIGKKREEGFKPSPGPFSKVADQFKGGVYIGDKSFERDFFGPSSSTFGGVRHF